MERGGGGSEVGMNRRIKKAGRERKRDEGEGKEGQKKGGLERRRMNPSKCVYLPVHVHVHVCIFTECLRATNLQ